LSDPKRVAAGSHRVHCRIPQCLTNRRMLCSAPSTSAFCGGRPDLACIHCWTVRCVLERFQLSSQTRPNTANCRLLIPTTQTVLTCPVVTDVILKRMLMSSFTCVLTHTLGIFIRRKCKQQLAVLTNTSPFNPELNSTAKCRYM